MGQYLKTRYPGIFQYVGKNGTVYGIDYYAGGKKHREIVGPLLGEAQKKLAEMKSLAKSGQVVTAYTRRRVTFDMLAEKYRDLQTGNGPFENSDVYIVKTLSEYFKGKRLSEFTAWEIERFRKSRKETLTKIGNTRSDGSINRELQILRHMLNKAVDWGMLDSNPFHRLKSVMFQVSSRDRFIEQDQIRRLLDASPSYLADVIMAGIFTGLRKGDILNLRWSNVNLEKGFLTYWEQKKKKFVSKSLNNDMIELLMRIPKGESDYIFLGAKGKPLRHIFKPFKSAKKKAGINDFHFHDLRHTVASHLVMRGASVKFVTGHLDHTSAAMTDKYSHLSEAFQKEQINLLNGICGDVSKKIVRSDKIPMTEDQNNVGATA